MASSSGFEENVFEYNYITEPDHDLKCPICLDVAKDPLQHEECGKLFCKECIERHGKEDPCPHCKTQGSLFYQDKKSQKNVLALRVMCSGECKWEGTVGDLESTHAATCEFALVPCPKQCKGRNMRIRRIVKSALSDHLASDCPNRDYECEYCEEKDTYKNIVFHHETCERMVLSCPNAECTDSIERRSMKRHIEDCAYADVPCKYRRVGCDVTMKRSGLAEHESDNSVHFPMVLDQMVAMRAQLASLEERMSVIRTALESR